MNRFKASLCCGRRHHEGRQSHLLPVPSWFRFSFQREPLFGFWISMCQQIWKAGFSSWIQFVTASSPEPCELGTRTHDRRKCTISSSWSISHHHPRKKRWIRPLVLRLVYTLDGISKNKANKCHAYSVYSLFSLPFYRENHTAYYH